MNKILKVLLIFLAFDILVVAGYFGYKALAPQSGIAAAAEYEWITVDESYEPKNDVERFIKTDAEQKGLLPVSIRNYGRSAAVLKSFQGSNFARPNETVLGMSYPGLEDWMLLDIKYKNENERDIQRTVLYVMIKGQWRVGDSGRLIKSPSP